MHTFTISDMTCGGCAAAISKAIHQVDPAAVIQADPATRQVIVKSGKPAAEIAQTILMVGYRVVA